MMGVEPIERYRPPTDGRPWLDSSGVDPVALYLRYLVERRAWEQRAIRAGGISSNHGQELLEALAALHESLSTPRPLRERDASVVQPPARDPRHVAVRDIGWEGEDLVRIKTSEGDIDPRWPSAYEITVQRVDGRWRLAERVVDHGRGGRLRLL